MVCFEEKSNQHPLLFVPVSHMRKVAPVDDRLICTQGHIFQSILKDVSWRQGFGMSNDVWLVLYDIKRTIAVVLPKSK